MKFIPLIQYDVPVGKQRFFTHQTHPTLSYKVKPLIFTASQGSRFYVHPLWLSQIWNWDHLAVNTLNFSCCFGELPSFFDKLAPRVPGVFSHTVPATLVTVNIFFDQSDKRGNVRK